MSTEPQRVTFDCKRKRETMTCKVHNRTYEDWVFYTGGQWRPVPCYDCRAELGIAINAKTAEVMERNAKEREERRLEATKIPERYLDKTIYNYNTETEQQRKALATIKNYLAYNVENKKSSAGLIMAGNSGTGKTHLACGIGIDLCKRGRSVEFWTVSALFKSIRESYKSDSSKTEQQSINYFANMDMLIIDEIGVQKGSESEEYLLFDVINERYNLLKPTILITNLEPDDIRKTIGGRVVDRLKEGGGKFVNFNWESYRAKRREPQKSEKKLTYYEAFTDAQKQLEARKLGEDEWLEPCAYWAAVELGEERVIASKYSEVRDEWEVVLERRRVSGEAKEIPQVKSII